METLNPYAPVAKKPAPLKTDIVYAYISSDCRQELESLGAKVSDVEKLLKAGYMKIDFPPDKKDQYFDILRTHDALLKSLEYNTTEANKSV